MKTNFESRNAFSSGCRMTFSGVHPKPSTWLAHVYRRVKCMKSIVLSMTFKYGKILSGCDKLSMILLLLIMKCLVLRDKERTSIAKEEKAGGRKKPFSISVEKEMLGLISSSIMTPAQLMLLTRNSLRTASSRLMILNLFNLTMLKSFASVKTQTLTFNLSFQMSIFYASQTIKQNFDSAISC